MGPTVSIIIPCYNNGNLLSKMIDCILRQTFSNWELIIVDDCSTDNTHEFVQKYRQNESRINFIIRNRDPKGSAVCRNIGFEKATGKYVIHFDADDLISDTCLEKRVAFMEENQDIDYASFPAKMWYADNPNPPKYTDWGKTWGVGKNGMDLLSCFLKADYPFSVWNNIYKCSSLKNLFWDEQVKIYTDFSFIVPCILAGLKHRFSGLKEVDYYYRIYRNAGNMCSSFVNEEKQKSTIYLIKNTLTLLENTNNYNKYRHNFIRFIQMHYGRLLLDMDIAIINNYLSSIQNNYPKSEVARLEILKFIIFKIKKRTICQTILRYIYFVWFEYQKYFNILKINILSKINVSCCF
jgi:glycosyltransferase involved in cell wall biosynthesis